ncbi:MAG: hypothetical protein ABEL97_07825 [Salinibacter sp.]
MSDDPPTVLDYLRGWMHEHVSNEERAEAAALKFAEGLSERPSLPADLSPDTPCTDVVREALTEAMVGDPIPFVQVYKEEIAAAVDETFAEIVSPPFARLGLQKSDLAIEEITEEIPGALADLTRAEIQQSIRRGDLSPLPEFYEKRGAEELRQQVEG